jgi:hypothetical protein
MILSIGFLARIIEENIFSQITRFVYNWAA